MGNELSEYKILSVGVGKEENTCPSITKWLPVQFRHKDTSFWYPPEGRDAFKSRGSHVLPPLRFFAGWTLSSL